MFCCTGGYHVLHAALEISHLLPFTLQVYQGGVAAGATSSDLAAAQALAELRHEDEEEADTDSMESGEEELEEEEREVGSSGAGYGRGFRVTAPPLPLWVPGTSFSNFAVDHPLIHQVTQSSTSFSSVCSIIHPFTHPRFIHAFIQAFCLLHLSVHICPLIQSVQIRSS